MAAASLVAALNVAPAAAAEMELLISQYDHLEGQIAKAETRLQSLLVNMEGPTLATQKSWVARNVETHPRRANMCGGRSFV
jgi:hypothetical protein